MPIKKLQHVPPEGATFDQQLDYWRTRAKDLEDELDDVRDDLCEAELSLDEIRIERDDALEEVEDLRSQRSPVELLCALLNCSTFDVKMALSHPDPLPQMRRLIASRGSTPV